jgi:hypothetical protein
MKQILVLLLGIIIISCSNNPVPKPDNLLSEEVMKDMLFDVVVLQAAETTVGYKLNQNNLKLTSFIYKKYKIDSLTYYQNQKFYAANPKKYKKMYKEISDRLAKIQSETQPKQNIINVDQPEFK